MISKLGGTPISSVSLFSIVMLCCVGVGFASSVAVDDRPIQTQEIQHPETTIENDPVITKPVVADEIALKQREMLNTIVMIQTRRGSGSGTIIDRLETDVENVFEYRVLTNAHVTHLRFTDYLRGVDSITGKVKVEVVDTGCGIIVFDHPNKSWDNHTAKVVAENMVYDLSILSFISSKELAVAKIADKSILEIVRVFDEVFAIGCQLSHAPSPTVGIISQILIGKYGNKEWIIYGNTAQITSGSSGGGLFKKYDGHYYLIGIPYRVSVTNNGQTVPHLSHAISIKTAREFINQNSVICP